MTEIDARAARRRFDRAAAGYLGAARLELEVGERMLERLDYVRLAPACILDAGCGPAPQAEALARRYPGARLLALDFSQPMLARARGARGWLARLRGRGPLAVCAALERLPLAAGSIEFAWSNMALHWAADLQAALAELARVLAPGGLLMFSTLGPDTLKELRAAAGEARVHSFADMHDLGDALVAAGFAAPVMDMEMLTLAYRGPLGLVTDLRASGQTLARGDRARGFAPRALRAALAAAGASASIEVIYGHAWKGVPRKLADGRSIVHFERRPLP
ncbi:MAG: methyltransferase domain-containing protein [Betaproteobacteria bacterium]|nr:methyltransferase domain-containing protein [Betaproteobacteria bacterium]MDH5221093.1 methyltransferase domain-containing protein [Betaproteobacteria bacterium]MDH5349199.1 methyltransferase domain-containing protein [Betaproteobacteria bacterium]